MSGPPRDRLFGITSTVNGSTRISEAWMASEQSHLRMSPEYAGRIPGPHKPDERNETGARHPILVGFDKTDILPYGGPLGPLTVDPGRSVLATFVPLDGPVATRAIFNQPSIASYLQLSQQGRKHAALAGFEEVRVIPYGGVAVPLKVSPARQVLATYAVASVDEHSRRARSRA